VILDAISYYVWISTCISCVEYFILPTADVDLFRISWVKIFCISFLGFKCYAERNLCCFTRCRCQCYSCEKTERKCQVCSAGYHCYYFVILYIMWWSNIMWCSLPSNGLLFTVCLCLYIYKDKGIAKLKPGMLLWYYYGNMLDWVDPKDCNPKTQVYGFQGFKTQTSKHTALMNCAFVIGRTSVPHTFGLLSNLSQATHCSLVAAQFIDPKKR